jgi:hypothetical protein
MQDGPNKTQGDPLVAHPAAAAAPERADKHDHTHGASLADAVAADKAILDDQGTTPYADPPRMPTTGGAN